MLNHTFIIPAYGESPYLEECVQHLMMQSEQSDIIITTATPNNHIRQIAEKYKVPFMINNGPGGIANDWNFALAVAGTPLVTIAHQDDIYEADYARSVRHSFAGTGSVNALIAFTDYRDMINGSIRKYSLNRLIKNMLLLPFMISKRISSTPAKKLMLMFGDPICCPSVTFNKAALSNFKFSTDYHCTLDWLAWYELAGRSGAFIYINKKLVKHRIHPGSETTNQLKSGRRKQEELQLFELMWGKQMAKLLGRLYALGHKDNL